MHALPPAKNVILVSSLATPNDCLAGDLQVRVDTRDSSFSQTIRKRSQPTFRFPFVGIVTPQCLTSVRRQDADDDRSIGRDRYFIQELPIFSFDRSMQRQHAVLVRPDRETLRFSRVSKLGGCGLTLAS